MRAVSWLACALFAAARAAEPYQVEFEITLSKGNVGHFTVEVYPDWAPLGAARFLALVGDGFFSSKARERERSNVSPLSLRSRT